MGLDQREQDIDPKAKSKGAEDSGFLGRILSLFMGANDPEKEKKRLLKLIGKELKKSRHKFYNPRGDQALPGLAKFFFEIFKVVGPAQTLLQNSEVSAGLRNIIIEMFLTDEQLALRDTLSEEVIREKAKTLDTKELAAEIKEAMISLFSFFDNDMMKQINSTYNLFMVFHTFVSYDYYFLLKKFDSNLSEHDYNYTPKFEMINGEYIADDLKDFLEVFLPLEKDANWDMLFDVLKEYRNVDIVSRPAWKKITNLLDDVKRNGVFDLIVRHVDKDPYFKAKTSLSNERIVEPYLNKLKTQTEMLIQKILQEKKGLKVEKLATLVFGTSAVARMKNYTDRANVTFSKKLLSGYTHTQCTNYLKAFLIDYVKKDAREIRDLLIVRGKWTTNLLSQQLSDSFHSILDLADQLVAFDDACADEGDYGVRIPESHQSG